MKREKLNLTAEDGYSALRDHLVERARVARARYGPVLGVGEMEQLLVDADVVRFPTRLVFADEPLMPGEFGWARPRGRRPSEGFDLVLHPRFQGDDEAVPLLAAYHVVAINYLDVATHEEAELFGAALFGLEVEEYYGRVCALADTIPEMPTHDPMLVERFESAAEGVSLGSSGGGGGCSCSGGA
ncbi:MAG: hypothetical protein GY711_09490 [bacterium]|nr:hypothetical protein [bacterium]